MKNLRKLSTRTEFDIVDVSERDALNSVYLDVIVPELKEISSPVDVWIRPDFKTGRTKNKSYLGGRGGLRHERMLLNMVRTGSDLFLEQLKP